MDKINPNEYLTNFTPEEEAVVLASDWYDTELTTLIDEDADELGWMLAQGWNITSKGHGATYLKRVKLNTEKALNHLIESYTASFNEGRTINDQRYDDIIALFAATIDKTEDSLNVLEANETAFNDLITILISNLDTDFSSHETDVNEQLDDWGDSERERIDREFDNKLAADKDFLIRKGLYNTSNYTVRSDGNTRERAIADTDLEDKILERQLALKDRLYTMQIDIRNKVLDARTRLVGLLQGQGNARLTLRNRIIEALANFAERRSDTYPDINKIGEIATNMGVGGSNTGFTP